MRSREDLAWAAGFYEGEGTIALSGPHYWVKGEKRLRKTRRPQMRIGQVDREPLDRFVAATGIGYVHGPFHHENKKWQSYYQLVVTGFEKSQALVALLWPWLSERRKQQAMAVLLIGR
jgi:hypothetical protein